MDAGPDQILQRLEELRRWQEEQHNALLTKQIAQREMLHLEKNKLYEMFGISLNSTVVNETASETSDVQDGSRLHPGLLEEIQRSEKDSQVSVAEEQHEEDDHDINKELGIINEEPIGTNEGRTNENPTTRPFLKRGEGLKARFKVHPNELRLDNLPKYKFAGSHPKLSRKQRRVTRSSSDNEPVKIDLVEEETPFARPLPDLRPPSGEKWQTLLAEPQPVQRTRSNISIQDTPTRQMIREQQREIEELDLFEHIEANIQSFAPTEFSQESSSGHPRDSTANSPPNGPGRVQFMSQVQINEVITELSDTETINSTDLNDIPTNQTSTPNTRTAFHAFKTQLFGSTSISSQQTQNDTTIVPDEHISGPALAFIQQQSQELTQTLLEVESEMELFRSQNQSLTKFKQQLDLDRVQLDVDRADMEERLNDERCKMEVYLHDERMKLLNEKETLDRRAKELRAPNRKERDEMVQLKAQVAALEAELVTKEQRHVAAQGRLRAQIRTMEKDLKEYSFDIENMKKENKKLESENVKLRRQSNNKMLNEINKNIARLAVGPASKNISVEVKTTPTESVSKPISKLITNRSKAVELSSSGESEDDQPQPEKSVYFKDSVQTQTTSQTISKPRSTPTSMPTSPSNDQQQNCKREILNQDGSRDILYTNGNIKKVSKDAMLIRMLYFNKDVKETNISEGTVKYYYAATNTWHTSYLDGLEILEFPK